MKANFNVTKAAKRMRQKRVWLAQRLYKCEVNGKKVEFTKKELERLTEIIVEMTQETLTELKDYFLKS